MQSESHQRLPGSTTSSHHKQKPVASSAGSGTRAAAMQRSLSICSRSEARSNWSAILFPLTHWPLRHEIPTPIVAAFGFEIRERLVAARRFGGEADAQFVARTLVVAAHGKISAHLLRPLSSCFPLRTPAPRRSILHSPVPGLLHSTASRRGCQRSANYTPRSFLRRNIYASNLQRSGTCCIVLRTSCAGTCRLRNRTRRQGGCALSLPGRSRHTTSGLRISGTQAASCMPLASSGGSCAGYTLRHRF